MKYTFILFSPWLLKSPVFQLQGICRFAYLGREVLHCPKLSGRGVVWGLIWVEASLFDFNIHIYTYRSLASSEYVYVYTQIVGIWTPAGL